MARNVIYRAALILILMFSVLTLDGFWDTVPSPFQKRPGHSPIATTTCRGFRGHSSGGDDPAAEERFSACPYSRAAVQIEILNDLAISLVKQGKLADAIPFYKRALLSSRAT